MDALARVQGNNEDGDIVAVHDDDALKGDGGGEVEEERGAP